MSTAACPHALPSSHTSSRRSCSCPRDSTNAACQPLRGQSQPDDDHPPCTRLAASEAGLPSSTRRVQAASGGSAADLPDGGVSPGQEDDPEGPHPARDQQQGLRHAHRQQQAAPAAAGAHTHNRQRIYLGAGVTAETATNDDDDAVVVVGHQRYVATGDQANRTPSQKGGQPLLARPDMGRRVIRPQPGSLRSRPSSAVSSFSSLSL